MAHWHWYAFRPAIAGTIGYAPPPASVPGLNSRPYRMIRPKRLLPPHTHFAARGGGPLIR